MLTPPLLVDQMIDLTSDELPSRWLAKWNMMQGDAPLEDERLTLQQWLEDVYFYNDRQVEFTMEELAKIKEAIACLLKLEPSLRATPREVLAQEWFR